MFHQTVVCGNLGRDPEIRQLDNGKLVTTFSVAGNNNYTRDGQRIEETTWYRVSVFGAQAQACHDYLRKGRAVLVVGRLKPDPETGGPRVWIRDDGTPGAQYDLVAQSVQFIGRGDDSDGTARQAVASGTDDYNYPF